VSSMPRFAKMLIGLGAALLAGWLSHGPLGQGEAFVAAIETKAQAEVREAAVPGVDVRLARDPLRREAFLSGPANDFQREGQGLLPGLNDRMLAVPGVGAVTWADSGPVRGGRLRLPLLAETELLVLGFFLLGVAIGRLLFRPRRDHYL
jgi:hypothetical protein